MDVEPSTAILYLRTTDGQDLAMDDPKRLVAEGYDAIAARFDEWQTELTGSRRMRYLADLVALLPESPDVVGCRKSVGAAVAPVASGVPVGWRPPLLVSALYIVVSRLLELIVLVGRCDRAKEVEILVLRHELSIRDAKFRRTFDALSATEKIKVIRTPVQAPNANAHMERWVGTVRRECLDRLLIISRRQLDRVLRVYVDHYNRRRPHRALDLNPPDLSTRSSIGVVPNLQEIRVRRRNVLGGLIHEYELAAAA